MCSLLIGCTLTHTKKFDAFIIENYLLSFSPFLNVLHSHLLFHNTEETGESLLLFCSHALYYHFFAFVFFIYLTFFFPSLFSCCFCCSSIFWWVERFIFRNRESGCCWLSRVLVLCVRKNYNILLPFLSSFLFSLFFSSSFLYFSRTALHSLVSK